MRKEKNKTHKTCTQCHDLKRIEDFYICHNKGKPVRKSECKLCTKMRNMRLNKIKPPVMRRGNIKYLEYQRKYYEENREKFASYRMQFRQKHPTYFKDRYAKRKQKAIEDKTALIERDIA